MTKRITKKELKQPDQFQSLSVRIYELVLEHRQKIYLCSGIAALLIVIALGWYFYQLRYESKADNLYAESYASYASLQELSSNRAMLEEAAQRYEELISTYPSSRAALVALYNLGNLYFNLEAYDKSIQAYETYIRKTPQKSMLIPLAWYGLGYSYEAKGDFEEALDSFSQAVRKSSTPHFLLINYANMARIYEQMNEVEKAVEYYEMVIQGDSDQMMALLAKNRISMIK